MPDLAELNIVVKTLGGDFATVGMKELRAALASVETQSPKTVGELQKIQGILVTLSQNINAQTTAVNNQTAAFAKQSQASQQAAAGQQRVATSTNQATQQIAANSAAANALERYYNSLWGTLAKLTAGYSLFRLTLDSLKSAGRMEQAEIGLAAMLRDTEKAAAMMVQLKAMSKDTGVDTESLLQSTRLMVALGTQTQTVLPMMRTLVDTMRAMGGSGELLNRIVLALGQMQSKGKVAGEEMRQLAEAGVPAWKILADKMGVDISTVMNLVEARAVNVNAAIIAIVDGLNARFSGMAKKGADSLGGFFDRLKSSATLVKADIGDAIAEAFGIDKNTDQYIQQFVRLGRVVADAIRIVAGLKPQFMDTAGSAEWLAGKINLVMLALEAIIAYKAISAIRALGAAFLLLGGNSLIAAAAIGKFILAFTPTPLTWLKSLLAMLPAVSIGFAGLFTKNTGLNFLEVSILMLKKNLSDLLPVFASLGVAGKLAFGGIYIALMALAALIGAKLGEMVRQIDWVRKKADAVAEFVMSPFTSDKMPTAPKREQIASDQTRVTTDALTFAPGAKVPMNELMNQDFYGRNRSLMEANDFLNKNLPSEIFRPMLALIQTSRKAMDDAKAKGMQLSAEDEKLQTSMLQLEGNLLATLETPFTKVAYFRENLNKQIQDTVEKAKGTKLPQFDTLSRDLAEKAAKSFTDESFAFGLKASALRDPGKMNLQNKSVQTPSLLFNEFGTVWADIRNNLAEAYRLREFSKGDEKDFSPASAISIAKKSWDALFGGGESPTGSPADRLASESQEMLSVFSNTESEIQKRVANLNAALEKLGTIKSGDALKQWLDTQSDAVKEFQRSAGMLNIDALKAQVDTGKLTVRGAYEFAQQQLEALENVRNVGSATSKDMYLNAEQISQRMGALRTKMQSFIDQINVLKGGGTKTLAATDADAMKSIRAAFPKATKDLSAEEQPEAMQFVRDRIAPLQQMAGETIRFIESLDEQIRAKIKDIESQKNASSILRAFFDPDEFQKRTILTMNFGLDPKVTVSEEFKKLPETVQQMALAKQQEIMTRLGAMPFMPLPMLRLSTMLGNADPEGFNLTLKEMTGKAEELLRRKNEREAENMIGQLNAERDLLRMAQREISSNKSTETDVDWVLDHAKKLADFKNLLGSSIPLGQEDRDAIINAMPQLKAYEKALQDIRNEKARLNLVKIEVGLGDQKELSGLFGRARERRQFEKQIDPELNAGFTKEAERAAQREKMLREFEELQNSKEIAAAADGIANSFGNAFNDVILGAQDLRQALGNIFMDISRQLLTLMVTKPLTEGLAGMVYGGLSGLGNMMGGLGGLGMTGAGGMAPGTFTGTLGSAHGNVVDAFAMGGVVSRYMKHDVVSAPALFPLGKNRLGMLGEAGPEAIIPVKKTGYGYGITALIGNTTQVIPLTRAADGKLAVQLKKENEAITKFAMGGVIGSSGEFSAGGTATILRTPNGEMQAMPWSNNKSTSINQPGEKVVEKRVTHITNNISTPNADSFRRSENQIVRSMRSKLS